MRVSLIDIGSNTIRLVIYEDGREILNVANHANLISAVRNGEMSVEGLSKLVSCLKEMKSKIKEYKCEDIYAFATASLRDISDKESLCNCVKELTGIEMNIISGEEEAIYDYLGLKKVHGEESGMAFDLGGGSCQIIVYENGEVKGHKSLKIGSLKLYGDFVSGLLPDEEEKKKIAAHVKEQLSCLEYAKNAGCEKIYAMGGAAYALMQLSEKYFAGEKLSVNTLEKITELSESEILAVCPKRLKTVIPAAVTVIEILKFSESSYLYPTTAGVRDGIYISKYKNA